MLTQAYYYYYLLTELSNIKIEHRPGAGAERGPADAAARRTRWQRDSVEQVLRTRRPAIQSMDGCGHDFHLKMVHSR